jgi:thiol-disulfide isomerase/thioredoxin
MKLLYLGALVVVLIVSGILLYTFSNQKEPASEETAMNTIQESSTTSQNLANSTHRMSSSSPKTVTASKSTPSNVMTPSVTPTIMPNLSMPSPQTVSPLTPQELAAKNAKYEIAPELVHPDGYLNSGGSPVTLAEYRGRDVVLLEFWTYSCINCERTLPYLVSWYAKYKDQGFVIKGVHTPEFSYEHLESNVSAALKKYGIEYPVVLDNEYQTWNAYGNQFWPHLYVIDVDGYITYDHIGEGNYDQTEQAIQAALAERAARL